MTIVHTLRVRVEPKEAMSSNGFHPELDGWGFVWNRHDCSVERATIHGQDSQVSSEVGRII